MEKQAVLDRFIFAASGIVTGIVIGIAVGVAVSTK
jgi:hypothetical protein